MQLLTSIKLNYIHNTIQAKAEINIPIRRFHLSQFLWNKQTSTLYIIKYYYLLSVAGDSSLLK